MKNTKQKNSTPVISTLWRNLINKSSSFSKIKSYPTTSQDFSKSGLNLKTNSAFTLVELIVVIVILAILATIAFLSFSSYSSSARDSTRLSDMTNITAGLEVFQVRAGSYPMPDGLISTGTIKGVDLVYKGVLGERIGKMIGLSKVAIDPLENNQYYPYGITYDKKKYQVAITTEENATAYNISDSIINKAYADSNNQARVKGNYLGVIRFSTGTSTYLANVPSLLYNFKGTAPTTGVDLLGLTSKDNVFFIVDKNNNLPYSIGKLTEINNKTPDTLIGEIYKNSAATFTGINITDLVKAKTDTEKSTAITGIFGDLASTESKTLLASFGITGTDPTQITGNIASVISGNGGGSSTVGVNGNDSTPVTPAAPVVTTFTLSKTTLEWFSSVKISDNCVVHPSSYIFSPNMVENAGFHEYTTNMMYGTGVTTITPVGGDCEDNSPKTLTIITPLTKWSFNANSPLFAVKGDTFSVYDDCTVHPTDYTSSNPSVISKVGGVFTALAGGTTTITAVGGNCEHNGPKTITIPCSMGYRGADCQEKLPVCDAGKSEITLSNGQTWSCKNAGASNIGDIGNYYSWGTDHLGNISLDDNAWGGSGTTFEIGTSKTVGAANLSLMRGPCEEGWHVPTSYEWALACENMSGYDTYPNNGINNVCSNLVLYNSPDRLAAFNAILNLPYAGIKLDNIVYSNGENGSYWTSTNSAFGISNSIQFNPYQAFGLSSGQRASSYSSVRCLKN